MNPTDCTDCKRGGTFVKNRIMISALCICILLAASGCGVGAGSDVPSDDNREEVEGQDGFELQEDVEGQELAQNDTQILLADIAAQCEVWERRYGEENTLPVEIFQDLQRYVAEGKCEEALLAYRQEELICTVEEVKEVCPDFETLVEQCFEREYGENCLETNRIYRLETEDGQSCFLLFYRRFDADREGYSFLGTRLLKLSEEGWLITGNSSGLWGGVDDYGVFAREESGQKVYYLLRAYFKGNSSAWLELTRISESFSVPIDGWDITFIKTGVRPEILFQETGNDLAAQAKEYVEENAWFLAWMQQNGNPIWGDEDEQAHAEMRDAVESADEDAGMEQIWLIDFEEDSVFFQMTEAEDGTFSLDAYTREGDSAGALLLSCRICFIKEAGVYRLTQAYYNAFDFNGLTMRNTEDVWLWNEVQKQACEEQQQRNIAQWQGDIFVSEELFELLREEALTGIYGGENALLESYRLDLTEDTEIFMQRVAETDWRKSIGLLSGDWECKWAYRWTEEDGSENFLSCINYNYAKDSIQWWKIGEEGLEEYDYIMEAPLQMICCGGQFYCITEAAPEYRGGEVSIMLLEIGDSENWRYLFFAIQIRSFDDQDLACIPLYEAEELSDEVKNYVQEWYEAIVEACIGVSLFSGTEEWKELTAEESRMLNSLSDGKKDRYANHHYFACDVDNDGIVEYGYANYRGYLDVTFYEKEYGQFRIIPLEEVIHDSAQSSVAETLVETSFLQQLWCEEMGDTTYLFTVEGLAYSPDYILRIRVLKDDCMEEKAVYLLKVDMEEVCYDWRILEITPTSEGVG